MATEQQSTGNCLFCNSSMDRAGMIRHLKSCKARAEQITIADEKGHEEKSIFHLQIQDAYSDDYWLHLEMAGEATLKKLDKYLRVIWLECCGHLSQFSYERWGDRIPMARTANQIFKPGLKIRYVYDFGSSSELFIKVAEKRSGSPLTSKPIFLMARNDPPEYVCEECGEPAQYYCFECVIEEEKDGYLCDKHAEKHPHDEYGEPFEIVNSPRLGICGYDGPAEPPY